eukprot:TRINITY_DN9716_c0_g1_i3.p1 TRINITY_DN9716_c0_g1~~TRINITY_DN9716_c0_g1_i3.p1  ORF type:complete len:373 (-),score=74.91 TRINITY_DN9716_c0_g1_i3:417-1535(-)
MAKKGGHCVVRMISCMSVRTLKREWFVGLLNMLHFRFLDLGAARTGGSIVEEVLRRVRNDAQNADSPGDSLPPTSPPRATSPMDTNSTPGATSAPRPSSSQLSPSSANANGTPSSEERQGSSMDTDVEEIPRRDTSVSRTGEGSSETLDVTLILGVRTTPARPSRASSSAEGAGASETAVGQNGEAPVQEATVTAVVITRAQAARQRLLELLGGMQQPGDYLAVMRAALAHVGQEEEIPGLEEAMRRSAEEASRAGPPPASKEEVARLPRQKVTASLLAILTCGSLQQTATCPVCQEGLVEGEVLLEMPCRHLYHEDCITPWLEVTNSCPLCRSEMRTDDMEYEQKKERDAEDKEERRGVENALRQGEYAFI